MIVRFPPVEDADENGLLAIGGDLDVSSLVLAYRSGIFPWPIPGVDVLTWFAPPQRTILFLDRLHVPRRLERTALGSPLTFRVDHDVARVISSCRAATNRRLGNETWITEQVEAAYIALANHGFCHTVEAYRDNDLVGGLYGVSLGGMFAGESMFYSERDASKLCLLRLAAALRRAGVGWIDCQMTTPLFERFGAVEVERSEFMQLLGAAVAASELNWRFVGEVITAQG